MTGRIDVQVACKIQRRIENGELKPGAVLSAALVMNEQSVSRETAQRALRLLRKGGWVRFWPGIGHVVTEPDDALDQGQRPQVPPQTGDDDEIVTSGYLCRLFGVCHSADGRWHSLGILRGDFRTPGGQLRYRRARVDALYEAFQQGASWDDARFLRPPDPPLQKTPP